MKYATDIDIDSAWPSDVNEFRDIKTTKHIVDYIFENVTFRNCDFIETWIDNTRFRKCTFINCNITGDIRWAKFFNCTFEDVKFNLSYIRYSTFYKNCKLINLSLTSELIDERIFVNGKRYNSKFNNKKILYVEQISDAEEFFY